MDDTIGPALPPHLMKKKANEINKDEEDDCIKKSSVGIGPSLPPWMVEKGSNDKEGDKEDCFGPALPPGFKKSLLEPQPETSSSSDEDVVGPTIGPLPPSSLLMKPPQLSVAEEIEKRAKKMKDKLTGNEEPEKLEREEWMVELPPVLQGFGMGPRTFRTKAPEIGDRSVWTDIPSDKAKKKQTENLIVEPGVVPTKHEREVEQAIEEYNKSKRQESLMDMHDKKLKRKKKEEQDSGKKKERREFDRDTDLQANCFDNAKKKRLLKQSAGLSSRFSKSTTSTSFL